MRQKQYSLISKILENSVLCFGTILSIWHLRETPTLFETAFQSFTKVKFEINNFFPSGNSRKMITDYSHTCTNRIYLQMFRIFLFFSLYKIISQLIVLKLGQKINLAQKERRKRKGLLFRLWHSLLYLQLYIKRRWNTSLQMDFYMAVKKHQQPLFDDIGEKSCSQMLWG